MNYTFSAMRVILVDPSRYEPYGNSMKAVPPPGPAVIADLSPQLRNEIFEGKTRIDKTNNTLRKSSAVQDKVRVLERR